MYWKDLQSGINHARRPTKASPIANGISKPIPTNVLYLGPTNSIVNVNGARKVPTAPEIDFIINH